MSELKFACPVCGQHITADSSISGQHLECPTCFQRIVVPQAPASDDTKLILSAAQVTKPREVSTSPGWGFGSGQAAARKSLSVGGPLLILICVGTVLFVFREKIFRGQAQHSEQKAKGVPKTVYPIPTNIKWTLDLTNAVLPETIAVGSIHGSGFKCEKATLTGGNLTLRQGSAWPPDLGLSVVLFARAGEELSGKSVEVASDRAPPLPRVVLRWKDDQQKAATRNFSGGYALKVVFGEATNGRMPGRIFISLPDETRSFVAGSFDAEIRKPAPPKAPVAPKPQGG